MSRGQRLNSSRQNNVFKLTWGIWGRNAAEINEKEQQEMWWSHVCSSLVGKLFDFLKGFRLLKMPASMNTPLNDMFVPAVISACVIWFRFLRSSIYSVGKKLLVARYIKNTYWRTFYTLMYVSYHAVSGKK